MTERFVSAIGTVNDRIGRLASYLILLFAGVTLWEVIGRFAFNNPTIWAHETAKLLFGGYIVFGGAYTLLKGSHIRVDVLWRRIPPRARAIVGLPMWGFAFIFMGVLLWYSLQMAWRSVLIKQTSVSVFAPPIYPSKVCLAIGVALLLLQMMAEFVQELYAARGLEIISRKR